MLNLLKKLHEAKLRVSVAGGELKVRGPVSALDDQLKAELTRHRADLIALLESEGQDRMLPIVTVPTQAFLPLSGMQLSFWILHQISTDHANYNLLTCMRIGTHVELDALRRALTELIRRHRILHCNFRPCLPAELGSRHVAKNPLIVAARDIVHVVGPIPDDVLAYEDLSSLDESARDKAVLDRYEQELTRKPDLEHGSLLVARLLRKAADDHVLVVNMPHMLGDAESQKILLQELFELYEAEQSRRQALLEPVDLDHLDYAYWYVDAVANGRLKKQAGYWQQALQDAPIVAVDTDFPRTLESQVNMAGDSVAFEWSVQLTERVRAFARNAGVTTFALEFTAFALLLARRGAGMDVTISNAISGRHRAETRSMIGPHVNDLPLRLRLDRCETLLDAVKLAQQTNLDAMDNADLAKTTLLTIADIEGWRMEPYIVPELTLYQVCFNKQNDDEQVSVAAGGLSARPIDMPRNAAVTAAFELMLVITATSPRTRGRLNYRSALFTEATARSMLSEYADIVDMLVREPERSVASLVV